MREAGHLVRPAAGTTPTPEQVRLATPARASGWRWLPIGRDRQWLKERAGREPMSVESSVEWCSPHAATIGTARSWICPKGVLTAHRGSVVVDDGVRWVSSATMRSVRR